MTYTQIMKVFASYHFPSYIARFELYRNLFLHFFFVETSQNLMKFRFFSFLKIFSLKIFLFCSYFF